MFFTFPALPLETPPGIIITINRVYGLYRALTL